MIHVINTIQAVEWAISKDVDIIVLCLVLTRTTDNVEELDNAFKKARNNNIVVICSTADAGRNWKDTWPVKFCRTSEKSGYDNILGIGACDEFGNRLDETQDKGYPFQFKGKDIYVGAIPFAESDEQVTGSSVSTAIAAGIASLTLSCFRLAGNEKALGGSKRFTTINRKFEDMSAGNSVGPRYVQLQNFVPASGANFDDTLRDNFGPAQQIIV